MATLKPAAAESKQNEDPPEARQLTTELTPPDWPQLNGLFKNAGGKKGVVFNYHVFLRMLTSTYKAVDSNADLLLEETTFLTLLAQHSIQINDGSVLFKLFDIPNIPPPPQALVIDYHNNKYLKINLRG